MAKQITVGGADTKNLKIDAVEEREIQNFADDKETMEAVLSAVSEHVLAQESLLEPYHEELIYYDYMFRCGRNEEQKELHKPMAVPEDPRSDVGATMFFRQILQSAAKTSSLQNGRDRVFKYVPIQTEGVTMSDEDGRLQAEQMNTLWDWNSKQDEFETRIQQPSNMMVAKSGLVFQTINWVRERKLKKFSIPTDYNETTKAYDSTEDIEVDVLTKNQASFNLLNPLAIRLDPTIDTVQKQECVAVTDVIGLTDAVSLVQQGYWSQDQFAKLDENTRWDGISGTLNVEDTDDNRGINASTNDNTGKFLQWRVWINLPIDDDGKLDELTVIPQRYVCDFLGNTIDDSVCMRIERNDDPDDEIPVSVVHDYPDEPGRLFHISKGAVLKSNYAVETTGVNQMVDGVSIAQNPPLIEKKGAVISKSRKFGRGARIIVKNNVNEDIKELTPADRTNTSLALLKYVQDDSKTAIHTDPAQMGEGLGARATATEASGVMKLSAAPSVANAKYITT